MLFQTNKIERNAGMNLHTETWKWKQTSSFIYIFISTVCPGYKWSAWDGTFKLTDTFNWDISHPQTMWAFYTDSPSPLLFLTKYKRKKKRKKKNNEKNNNKKNLEYCSEAVLKVRYIIYTENKNAT